MIIIGWNALNWAFHPYNTWIFLLIEIFIQSIIRIYFKPHLSVNHTCIQFCYIPFCPIIWTSFIYPIESCTFFTLSAKYTLSISLITFLAITNASSIHLYLIWTCRLTVSCYTNRIFRILSAMLIITFPLWNKQLYSLSIDNINLN